MNDRTSENDCCTQDGSHDLGCPNAEPRRNPEMSKAQAEEFFGHLFLGKHHIPGEIKRWGSGWKVNAYGDLATFDFDALTRLVLLAHDFCVRAEVMQGGPRAVGIAIWQRGGREGPGWYRHPTIEQALERWRKSFPLERVKS